MNFAVIIAAPADTEDLIKTISEHTAEKVDTYCMLLLHFLFQGSNCIEYNLDIKLPVKYTLLVICNWQYTAMINQ